MIMMMIIIITERNLKVKLPTIQMKSRDGKSQRREEKKEDEKREGHRRKRIKVREKVGKLRNTAFSNDLWLRRVEE